MTFNPLFRTDYLIFWSLVIIALGAGLAWRSTRRARRPIRIGIVLLRGTILALLALIALNPGRWVSPPVEGRPFAAVLLDQSTSMATADVGGVSRWTAARDKILAARAALPEPASLRLYTFGDTLREVDAQTLAALAPDVDHTDIHGAGQALLNRFAAEESRLSGILILSDGRQTTPPVRADLAARAQAAGIPISAIPLGGPVPRRDLELRAVRRMTISFGNQEVRIPVQLHNRGLGDIRIHLVLSTTDGTELQQVPVDLPNDASQILTLRLDARRSGFERFHLSVAPQDGESSLANNRDEVDIATIDTPMRVLLLEGSPHWDSKFLTQLVRKQEGMDIVSIYRLAPERFLRIDTRAAEAKPVADQPFPATFEELAAYDLVIVGKGIEYFLTPERTALLQRYLSEAGGCVLFSRGKPYHGDFVDLSTIEPVTWGAPLGARVGMRPTLAGEEEGLFGVLLPGIGDPVWSRLPDASCSHRIAAVHGMGRVLLESAPGQGGTGTEGLPLVVSRRVGLGLSIVVNADGLWHWGFFPGDETVAELYRQFWIQFFYWAATHREFLPGQSFSLRIEPQTAAPQAPVRAFIGARQPVERQEDMPQLQVMRGDAVVETATPVHDGRRRWNLGLALSEPGLYTVELRHPVTAEPLGPRAVVERLAPPREQDDLSASPETLAGLTAAANGACFSLDAIDEALATVLPGDEILASSEQARWETLWDRAGFLLLLFALLAAEWTLRRRNGML